MTTAEQVRLKIGDPAGASQVFSDEEITQFLSDNDSDVRLAAADALDAMAASTAIIAKVVKRGNVSIDRSRIPEQLRKAAMALRTQVNDSPAFATVEQSHSDFAAHNIWHKANIE